MTEEHLSALLSAAEAKKDDKGWVGAADGRLFTFYVAYGGAGLTVSIERCGYACVISRTGRS